MKTVVLLLTLVAAVACCSGESVVVNVSEHGADSESCLQGKSNCSSLGYALELLTEFRSDVTINVFYTHKLNSSSRFHRVHNIAILGHPLEEDDYITISCPNLGTGLYFNYSTNITIRHMSWVNCGVQHLTTANAINWTNSTNCTTCREKLISPKAVSTLFVFNCEDLVLDYTHFSSDRGSGVSLYNVHGQVDITNSIFTNHKVNDVNLHVCSNISETTNSTCSPQATGLYIEMMHCTQFDQDERDCPTGVTNATKPANYTIINCYFQGNNNSGAYRNITDVPTNMEQSDISHWPFGRGGGMGVVLKAATIENFNLSIHNNTFDSNTAVYGGGMYFLLRSRFPDCSQIIWQYNHFSNNNAVYNGGGLCIEINVIYDTTVSSFFYHEKNNLHLIDTKFTGNTAYWGGGVAFTSYPMKTDRVDLMLDQCNFIENKYNGGGGAIALLLKEKPEKQIFFIVKVSFYACTFNRTIPVLADSYSQQIMSSTVHSEGIKLNFHDVTMFSSNIASALRLSDTGAVFHDDVTFYNNTGYDGGGVSLGGKSWITLASEVSVNFIGNRAYRYGGAIYYDPSPVLNMNMTSSCFVSYKPQSESDNEDVPLQNWSVNVSFTNNTALLAGDAAFVTDPRQCVWFDWPSLFDSNRTEIFNYSGQKEKAHTVSTPSRHLSFNCSSHKFIPANASNDLHRYAQYSLMPGEALNITLVTHDSTHQVIQSSLIYVSCYKKKDYKSYNYQNDACGEGKQYHIDRQVLSGSVLNDFKVYGSNPNGGTPNNDTDDLVLVFKTADPIPVVLPLLIKFHNCSNGFQYHQDNKKCVCLQKLNTDLSPVVCVNGMLPCVKHGYWYGRLNDNFVYHFCHNDRCRGSHVDSCEGYHGYIQLPTDDSLLCTNGLQGPLCTQCDDNHSLSYNSYECVECSTSRTVGLILLMLLECFVIVVVILGFLKLNMRVSTAWFYGFLYFYSVLRLLIWIPLPTGLDATIGIIVGVTSLDFQLLQYSGMCVSGFRAIHYEALHYLYPIAVMVMILVIVKMDRVRCRRSQFFTGESSVQALCIILLIIYTSISETSLNMLLPLSYGTTNNNTSINDHWYVKVDPGLPYMDTRNHLPFWLLAMSVELLLVLPFSLLKFVAPWTMRFINLSKIKPILDEYHNCFHDNCRWFAGVYLLARQLMFLLPIIGQGPELAIYLQQIFCLVLLLLVATIQPYREKSLNIIDVLLLSLLTFLSFTSSSVNGRRVYNGSLDIQVAVVGVAVVTPCIGLVTGMIVNKLCFRTSVVKRLFKLPMNSVLDIKKRTVRCTREDDLPPRFYDEEHDHDERTPLLRSTQGGSGNRAQLASNPTTPLSHTYSIND